MKKQAESLVNIVQDFHSALLPIKPDMLKLQEIYRRLAIWRQTEKSIIHELKSNL